MIFILVEIKVLNKAREGDANGGLADGQRHRWVLKNWRASLFLYYYLFLKHPSAKKIFLI